MHRRAHRRVDHLGADAVLVLLREARLAVERALVHLVDAQAGPLVVGVGVLAAAPHGDEPDRRPGAGGAVELPERMAPVNALLDACPAPLRAALLVGVLDRLFRPTPG